MFSVIRRAQQLGSDVLTAAIWISLVIAIASYLQLHFSDYTYQTSTLGRVKAVTTNKFSRGFGSRNRQPKENARIAFDLDTDLSDLFNWNTKQLFVYLTAEYDGASDIVEQPSNKMTFWDKIITSKEDAKINLRKERASYSLWDVEDSFRQRNATLKLEWNIQPHVGFLIFGKTQGNYELDFPAVKTESK